MAKRKAKSPPLPKGKTAPLVRRLWLEWMKPHSKALGGMLVLVVLVGATTGAYPVLIKLGFEALQSKDMSAIWLAPVLVVGITTAKGLSLWALTKLTNQVVTRIETDMQVTLYSHLIDADIAQLTRESPAALTQRFNTDFTFIKEALTRLSTVFLRETATVIALIAAMLWIDWFLTIVAAIMVPVTAIPIGKISRKLRRVATSTQEQVGAMAGIISESLAGAKVAKTYNLEKYLKHKAGEAFEDVRRLRIKGANARAKLDPFMEIAGGVAVAIVFVLIGYRIMNGVSTVGDFTGFVSALLIASQPVRVLGNLHAVLQEAMSALDRFYAVLDERPQIVDAPDAKDLVVTGGEIRLTDVHFRYRPDNDAKALDGIDLIVPPGKTTALVGRSGSGKSTVLALVPRLYDVTGGSILIDGQDIRSVTMESLRQAISVVSQDVVLFDDTVRANISFGRADTTEEEIVAAAKAAAAHDFIMRLPEGYDTRVGASGGRLSGGERQRVSIARAFLKNAPILLLDEATSALDSESESLVQAALSELMKGRTTLVVAHRLSTVRNSEVIAVMERGKVVERGNHRDLTDLGGVYARMRKLQLTDDLTA